MSRQYPIIATALLMSVVSSTSARAALIEFWNDAAGWKSAVGTYSMIDFVGGPPGAIAPDQYAHLGITFTNFVPIFNSCSFSDCWGVSAPDGVRIVLDTPHHAIAVDHLGVVKFSLYLGGELVATSSTFVYAGTGPRFSGIISDIAFDEVYMFKPQPPFSDNAIGLDNLYWGMPVPAPGTLALLALGACVARRRRRE